MDTYTELIRLIAISNIIRDTDAQTLLKNVEDGAVREHHMQTLLTLLRKEEALSKKYKTSLHTLKKEAETMQNTLSKELSSALKLIETQQSTEDLKRVEAILDDNNAS